ncbi:MAG: hypothetical protein LBC74_00945, partial [Planctomycetaceae bacterium]|nr:hypothetical protein [Planctomycetaceae bacterium]
MKKLFIASILFFVYLNTSLLFAQREIDVQKQKNQNQQTKFTPLGEDFLKNNNMNFDREKGIRFDVALFSKYQDGEKITFDKNSFIFDQIRKNVQLLINQKYIPDREFFEKHSLFYTVKNHTKVVGEDFSERLASDASYDIAYIGYKVDDILILIAVTDDIFVGATYVYLQQQNEKNDQKNSMELLKRLLIPETLKMIVVVDKKFNNKFNDPVIPVFYGGNALCLVRVKYFNTILPARGNVFSDWFDSCKKGDIAGQELDRRHNIITRYKKQYKTMCEKLIATSDGRCELIAAIELKELKKELKKESDDDSAVSTYKEIQRMLFDVLRDYYNDLATSIAHKGDIFLILADATSAEENDALRKLLRSSDTTAKNMALQLIEYTKCRSLANDILSIINSNKELTRTGYSSVILNGKLVKRYVFLEYSLLGQLGNVHTLNELNQKLQQKNISKELQNDIELAINHIKDNLAERSRRQQYWLDQRRRVREKKTAILSPDNPLMIDLDKPDPEPIDVDGYRNWSTTDGLFKTFAKFVGLQDNAAIKERDVKL